MAEDPGTVGCGSPSVLAQAVGHREDFILQRQYSCPQCTSTICLLSSEVLTRLSIIVTHVGISLDLTDVSQYVIESDIVRNILNQNNTRKLTEMVESIIHTEFIAVEPPLKEQKMRTV